MLNKFSLLLDRLLHCGVCGGVCVERVRVSDLLIESERQRSFAVDVGFEIFFTYEELHPVDEGKYDVRTCFTT